jgi:hypothetical protein
MRDLDLVTANANLDSLSAGILPGKTIGGGNKCMSLEQDSVEVRCRQSQRRQITDL